MNEDAAPTFTTDTSYYQRAVNDLYPHRWLIFRACDGTFRDPRFAENYAWATKATQRSMLKLRKPRLAGFTVYAVFRPGVDVLAVLKSQIGTPHPKLTVMLDVESWGGKILGNHSTEIIETLEAIAAWLGDHRRVIAYANKWDFLELFPNRPKWLKVIIAGYSSSMPTGIENVIGWQYSDGEDRFPVPDGYPRSSPPFGNCDHNVFPGLAPDQLANLLGVGTESLDLLEAISNMDGAPTTYAQFKADQLALMREANKYVDHVRHVDLFLGGDDKGSYHRLETFLGGITGFRSLVARGVVKAKAKLARR